MMALSIGIAIQNFPEGAIISMPLRSEGMGKGKAFISGVLSGIVEPFWSNTHNSGSGSYYSGFAVFTQSCCRCYDLCSG